MRGEGGGGEAKHGESLLIGQCAAFTFGAAVLIIRAGFMNGAHQYLLSLTSQFLYLGCLLSFHSILQNLIITIVIITQEYFVITIGIIIPTNEIVINYKIFTSN